MANGNNIQNTRLRVWWRHWSVVLILAILAGLVIWSMLNLGPWLRSWQDQRAAKSAQEQLEKLYRNDKYGGKTPEETFDMFIAALENDDVELASKYFVLNKQDQWKKTLEEYKAQNLLKDFVIELKNQKKIWKSEKTNDPNAAAFYYPVTIEKDSVVDFNGQKISIEAGTSTNTSLFQKYSNGIWKISIL
ncbi:MAG: hypothetical protein HYT61_01000 [Candidatus Yanofskybacteria bacterium]|nr:hypothetical protein [Candidatus Yanofskybacteria bacterium]